MSKREENNELFRRFRALDDGPEKQALRNQIAMDNYKLIYKKAGSYVPGGRAKLTEDHLQDAFLGLLKAIEMFDPERGFAFSTYAANWLRAHIQSSTYQQSGRTVSKHDKMPAPIAAQSRMFMLTHGREPTAEDLGVPDSKFAVWRNPVQLDSFDSYYTENTDDTGYKNITALANSDIQSADYHALLTAIEEARSHLTPRARDILDATLEDSTNVVAERFGLREDAVRKIRLRAMNEIRHWLAKGKK